MQICDRYCFRGAIIESNEFENLPHLSSIKYKYELL